MQVSLNIDSPCISVGRAWMAALNSCSTTSLATNRKGRLTSTSASRDPAATGDLQFDGREMTGSALPEYIGSLEGDLCAGVGRHNPNGEVICWTRRGYAGRISGIAGFCLPSDGRDKLQRMQN